MRRAPGGGRGRGGGGVWVSVQKGEREGLVCFSLAAPPATHPAPVCSLPQDKSTKVCVGEVGADQERANTSGDLPLGRAPSRRGTGAVASRRTEPPTSRARSLSAFSSNQECPLSVPGETVASTGGRGHRVPNQGRCDPTPPRLPAAQALARPAGGLRGAPQPAGRGAVAPRLTGALRERPADPAGCHHPPRLGLLRAAAAPGWRGRAGLWAGALD